MPTGPTGGPVLVVGAAGKTGRAVTAALRARGVPVRAAIRPGRVASAPAGTDAVPVDLTTGAGLEAALDGCRAAYHLAPNVHPDEVGMARRVAAAARVTGLPHLVFHSVLHPDDPRMPHHLRKAEAERILRGLHRSTCRDHDEYCGVAGDVGRAPGVVVLRPAAYHENLLAQVLGGEVVLPYSDGSPFSTVALGDVAEAAATVLLDPGHGGEVLDLAGPEVLTTAAMVEQAAEVLGRPVRIVRTTPAAWAAGPGAALDPVRREALRAMFAAYD
ncbi:MAG: NAD(P)H-binding protein, partial [Micrococcales bacterium]|nr:NAD(P)H-binding protein [Micrococcales bacterium]